METNYIYFNLFKNTDFDIIKYMAFFTSCKSPGLVLCSYYIGHIYLPSIMKLNCGEILACYNFKDGLF